MFSAGSTAWDVQRSLGAVRITGVTTLVRNAPPTIMARGFGFALLTGDPYALPPSLPPSLGCARTHTHTHVCPKLPAAYPDDAHLPQTEAPWIGSAAAGGLERDHEPGFQGGH
jgi:hypothetical protein